LLAFPVCCRAFFKDIWARQSCLDTTWAMTADAWGADRGRAATVSGPPGANILWRWMGVRLVPHLPCRFDCGDTLALAERLRAVWVEAGFFEELGWAEEILRWPVEWSALHGIAEIKTPILKVATRTDATAGKYLVRYEG